MPTPNARSNEGKVSGTREDAAFHADILGDDQLPPDLVDVIQQQARALGIDEDLIPPGPAA